jgi:hypothetical protein
LDVVTTFLNPEIDYDDIYMTLPEGWREELNAPKIVIRLRKALYGLKQAPRLWHNDMNIFLLSVGFTQSLADPNLYLRGDGILILLYVDDISMSYPEAAAKAAIEVNAKLSEKYKITNLDPATNFTALKSTTMVPGPVSDRKPISSEFSDDSAWRTLTMSRCPWIPMYNRTWPRIGRRWNWNI